MVCFLTQVNSLLWCALEEHLTPRCEHTPNPPTCALAYTWYPFKVTFLLLSATIVGCLCWIEFLVRYCVSIILCKQRREQFEDFCSVLKDSRLWSEIEAEESVGVLGGGNPKFLFGVATCTYQDSGSAHCPNSQWAQWERVCLPATNRSGASARLFELYQSPQGLEIITDRLHQLGVNSYRFSVEWSQIEPARGVFKDDILQIYTGLCKHLRNEGICPMVTLHHFSEPCWFHKAGSFENPDNIHYFVDFASKVVAKLVEEYNGEPLVQFFCTINEPGIEALSRFVRGSFSPGKILNFSRAGRFLKGALAAHCLAYAALKQIAPSACIGITHQRLTFIPNCLVMLPVTRYLNRLVDEAVLTYFRTGTFTLKIPLCCHQSSVAFPAPQTDFVGVQCYVRPVIGLTGSTSVHEAMTAMPFREDPESLYAAIVDVHAAFGRPVIVTENGVSTHDAAQRRRYLSRALAAARRAEERVGDGGVLGYFCWSLCDNFEWDMGMRPQAFGAFSAEGGHLAPRPKDGVDPLLAATSAWRRSLVPAPPA